MVESAAISPIDAFSAIPLRLRVIVIRRLCDATKLRRRPWTSAAETRTSDETCGARARYAD